MVCDPEPPVKTRHFEYVHFGDLSVGSETPRVSEL